jgi:hypothetical protein
MEISPIPGIRALPVMKTPPVDPRLSGVFDIENSSAPGDDSYSASGKKAAGGQDDEADDLEETTDLESQAETPEEGTNTGINFFA